MEAHRKMCFEQLRHKNACSIDELKSRLRKVIEFCSLLSVYPVNLFSKSQFRRLNVVTTCNDFSRVLISFLDAATETVY